MARQSPRKKGATSISAPAVDKPGRRCRICEGRPFKATCACSLNADGTRRIKKRVRKSKEPSETTSINTVTTGVLSSVTLPIPAVAPPQTWALPGDLSADGKNQNMQPKISSPGPHNTQQSGEATPDGPRRQSQVIDPALALNEESCADSLNEGLTPPTPPSMSPIPDVEHEDANLLTMSSLITMPDFSTNFLGDPTPVRTDRQLSEYSDSSSSDDEDIFPSTPCHSSPSQVSSTFKGLSSPAYQAAREAWKPAAHRKRAPRTKRAAIHGLVGGSMQGSLPLKIERQKPLRTPILDANKAARRFHREMNFVIARAERVALETASWVFIAGQQPQSRANFIHFSSNEMRTIALEETQQLVNRFSELVSDLREARTGNAFTAQRVLRETQTAFEAFQADVRKTLDVKDKQTEYLVGMVEALQQQMGIPVGALDLHSLGTSDEPIASGSKSM